MISIQLKPIQHKGKEQIGIYFEKNAQIQGLLQKYAKARWSSSGTCWHVPCTKESYEALACAIAGHATIQREELNKYLREKITNSETPLSKRTTPPAPSVQTIIPKKVATASAEKIYPENKIEFEKYTNQLVLKGYSKSTLRTYCGEFSIFLKEIKGYPAKDLTPERLQRYILYCINTFGLSENTIHSRINALKFYYEQVLHNKKMFFEIPRPKKPLILPKLLNEEEIRRLFNALTNKKHKAMLFTTYSAGLRVSELASLKIADIDSKRMQILIERAKGKKDRYVNLSPVLLDILRNYHQEYLPKPKEYLFESEQTHTAYPTRTIQQIFANAKRKAGIKKDVGIHSLRHSFATHLLDKGTDIRYIKDLLGHFNIKTTERYLHVSKQQLVNIVSPFDDLWKKESINW